MSEIKIQNYRPETISIRRCANSGPIKFIFYNFFALNLFFFFSAKDWCYGVGGRVKEDVLQQQVGIEDVAKIIEQQKEKFKKKLKKKRQGNHKIRPSGKERHNKLKEKNYILCCFFKYIIVLCLWTQAQL